MQKLILGVAAFILFLLYDLEQAQLLPRRFHKFVRFFFLIGVLLLLLSTAAVIWYEIINLSAWGIRQVFFSVVAVFFLLLLLYTLFFALPFEETYVSQNGCKTYERGMYALCRHPGVLWFTGCYACLWLAFGGMLLLYMAVLYCSLNILYVILQDVVTFPRVFTDYALYKQRVPFLIPTLQSIRNCIQTWNI